MEKTEMMKKYEAYSGETLEEAERRRKTFAFLSKYTRWLEAKAAAYDRLMSGGVITKKDVANVFGKVLVMTPNGYWQLWFSKPRRDKWGWHLDGGDTKSIGHTIAHFSDLNIIHDGSWKDSLTLPDGWEGK